MQFYTGDWLKDPAVSICAPATRGVWIDLLCAMHEAGRVGSLSGTRDQLARLARCVPADLTQALTDIQATGAADVTDRNGVVTVTNRRMNREAKEREANTLRQSRHRGSKASNGDVTPLSHLYEVDDEDSFFGDFPEVVRTVEFRKILNEWLSYKHSRNENYEKIGLKKMINRAAKLAAIHGIVAVMDAMERAMANTWQGWDQPNAFNSGKPSRTGPGQTHDPDAAKKDPNYGRM